MTTVPLLQLEGVSKSFGSGGGATHVLRSVDFQIDTHETVAIVGPSGCGKSTLLNIAGTLEPPSKGSVAFGGETLTGKSAKALAAFRRESLGFVFQHHHLLPQLTALENVLLPALAAPGSKVESALRERAEALLERVGLAERLNHRPATLSGGERQRVAVVRALVREPALVLADEPTGSLDAVAAEALGELLVEQSSREGAALLVVTHASRLASAMSRTVSLEGGAVNAAQASGTR